MSPEEKALALRVAAEIERGQAYNAMMTERGYPVGLGLTDADARALAALLREAAEDWRPIESAPTLDRLIVAGWQPRNGKTAGYWWYEEDATDERGKPIWKPEARLWHPFPSVRHLAPPPTEEPAP